MPRIKIQRYRNKRGRYIYKKRRYGRSRYRGIKRKVYRIARQMNVEFKRHYLQFTGNTINTTPTVSNCNIIDIGTGSNQRVGNQIKITSHYVNCLFSIHPSATNTQIRFIIVLDKQVNGSVFGANQLLRDTSVNDILVSQNDIDEGKRFKVLYNRLFLLSPEFPAKQFKFYKRHNLKVKYDGSTSSVADQTQMGLYLYFVSNEATNTPSLTLSSCIRYVDN